MLTRNQRFAVAVYKKVVAHKNRSRAEKDKYGTMAHKLPVLIRTAGLAQAITFLDAKNKEKMNEQLFDDLRSAVAEIMRFDANDFLQKCRENNLTEYLILTQNTLAALLWFKRFSVSVLEVKDNAQSD